MCVTIFSFYAHVTRWYVMTEEKWNLEWKDCLVSTLKIKNTAIRLYL